MTRVALKGISSRRMRTALTMFAIVLGVAMVSGAYTLTDTMRGASDSLSDAAYDGTAGVVSAKTAFDLENDDQLGARPTIPASTLDEVRGVPGVENAVGNISDEARIIGKDGDVVGGGPYFGSGVDPKAGDLTPFRLKEGRFATASGEVVIDAGTADKEGYGVGDEISVQGRGPERTLRVTGIATFGDVDSIGTATFVLMDLPAAQDMFQKQGRYDKVLVAGDDSVRAALRSALPGSLAVQTAADHDRFTLDGLNEFVSFISVFLLVFGGVAVFVGAFTIANTLSITVAQRSRELALLRALGASRRQVLRSVLTESLVIGTVASLDRARRGAPAGQGAVERVRRERRRAARDGHGVRRPDGHRLAGGGPRRDRPLRPLAGDAVHPRVAGHGHARGRRDPAGTVRAPLGLDRGISGDPVRDGARLRAVRARHRRDRPAALLAPGVLLLFIAVAAASSRIVPGLVSVLGRPGEKIAGIAGSLARRNAMRDPGRTAATASALMIGISLVAFSAVLGAGIRESTKGALEDQVRSDYVLVGQDGWSAIDPGAARAAAAVPGVKVATGLTQDQARAFGEASPWTGSTRRQLPKVFGWEWKDGSDASLAAGRRRRGGHRGLRRRARPRERHRVHGHSPRAEAADVRVVGVSAPDRSTRSPRRGDDLPSEVRRRVRAKRDRLAFVAADGVTEAAIDKALAGFPDVQVLTASEFADDQMSWVDEALGILYVLLACR